MKVTLITYCELDLAILSASRREMVESQMTPFCGVIEKWGGYRGTIDIDDPNDDRHREVGSSRSGKQETCI